MGRSLDRNTKAYQASTWKWKWRDTSLDNHYSIDTLLKMMCCYLFSDCLDTLFITTTISVFQELWIVRYEKIYMYMTYSKHAHASVNNILDCLHTVLVYSNLTLSDYYIESEHYLQKGYDYKYFSSLSSHEVMENSIRFLEWLEPRNTTVQQRLWG